MEREGTSLAHHGVKGMHWGEITKEYEPVAVDHRKTGNNQTSEVKSVSKRPDYKPGRSYIRKRYQQERNKRIQAERNEIARVKAEIKANNLKRRKIIRYGLYGLGAAAAIAAAYGAYKYTKITKAKAYSGILNRILKSNPVSPYDAAGGKHILKVASDKAAANSSTLKDAMRTNRYLKEKGLQLSKEEALRIYKTRKLIRGIANTKVG